MAEKAQVGDLIRVVDAGPRSFDTYKDGDILEVIGRFEEGNGVKVKETDLNGDTMLLYDTEYVIHRKAGEEDTINHPNHYTQGRFETIEIIEEITQGYSDGYVSYCVGNALKYLARAPFKHESPSEDIAKARAYLDFAINRLGGAE